MKALTRQIEKEIDHCLAAADYKAKENKGNQEWRVLVDRAVELIRILRAIEYYKIR